MPYRNRLKLLEATYKDLEIKITEAQKDSNFNKDTLIEMCAKRQQLYKDLSTLRRLQWEEDHERVDMDEDR